MALIVAIIFALISLKTNALISSFFWLLSLLSYISAPFVSVIIGKRRHKRRGKIVLDFQHAHISSSLTKRYNRFTVIIIAEIIASVVSGISGMANKEGNYLRLILFGVFVAFFVWTIYSETVAERETIGTVGAFISYHILHLFLTLAISLTGVALLCLLETTSVIGEPNPIYMMLTISILSLLLICGLFQYILKPLRHRVENAEKLSLLIASGIILVLSLILNKHPSLLRPLLLLDMFIPVIFIFLASVTGKPVEKQVSETVEKGIEIHEQRITKVQKEMEEKEKKIIKIISTENDEQEKN